MTIIDRRIKQLEEQREQTEAAVMAVVLYDSRTQLPLAPIVGAPTVLVWIPDNGRDK